MKFCTWCTLQLLVYLGLFVSPLFAAPPQLTQTMTFREMDKLIADDGAAEDRFGYAVAISGETMVISSRLDDDNGENSGSAYIFEKSGTNWIQAQKLTAGDGAADDSFGNSVAISGETVVIGSLSDDDNEDSSGSAYIFEKSGTAWIQVQKLTAADDAAYDHFGTSVAISGETVVISSSGDDDNGSNSGSAYIFEKSGTNWIQAQKLTANDGVGYEYFGQSVAISGETVVISSDLGFASGSAYIFEKSGTNWIQMQKLTANDAAGFDHFANRVAISGETVVISSDNDDDKGTSSGSAYIFEKSGTNWIQVQKLTADDGAEHDRFGYAVAISGETVVISSDNDDDKGTSSGSAYIFEKSGTNWIQVQKISASDGAGFDYFGQSVAISGETVVIGNRRDDNGTNSGSAYIFKPSLHDNSLEGKKSVVELEASDINNDYPINFSLQGGLDASLFTLDTSGFLQFKTAPDFEAPIDSNGDNIYEMYIQLRDYANEINGYRLSVRVGDIVNEQAFPRALSYEKLQKMQARVPVASSGFGNSVAISGETAVVAASSINRAYVYVYNDTSKMYEHKADLRPDDPGVGYGFGFGVAISGDTIAVIDPQRNNLTGATYIFDKPTDGWSGALGETTMLVGSDTAVNDYFGASVAIYGDTLVIAAHANDDNGINSGSAYVFKKEGDVWTEVAHLTASDGAAYDNFGVSVAIGSGAIVVGSFHDDIDTLVDAGSVYLFEKPFAGWSGNLTESAKLIASDGEGNDLFGYGVDISGDVVVVGTGSSSTTYLFAKPLTGWSGTLTEDALLIPSTAVDAFGPDVSIDGDIVVVGAGVDDDNGDNAGAIYLFEKPASGWIGTVTETVKFTSTSVAGDNLGSSIAIDQGVIFAGATGDDTGEINAGAAYVLEGSFLPGDVNNSTTVDLTDIITALQIATGSSSSNIVWEADVNDDRKIGTPEAIYSLEKFSQQ